MNRDFRKTNALSQNIYLVRLDVIYPLSISAIVDGDTSPTVDDREKKVSALCFHILGTSKVVYKVNFSQGQSPKCLCPDHKIRKVICKHIYFVCGKIINLNVDQFMKLTDITELSSIVKNRLPHLATDHVVADKSYTKKYNDFVDNKIPPEDDADFNIRNDDCCVCLFIIGKEKAFRTDVMVCPECHNGIHNNCWKKWCSVNKKEHQTCVYCRNPINNAKPGHLKLTMSGWGVLME